LRPVAFLAELKKRVSQEDRILPVHPHPATTGFAVGYPFKMPTEHSANCGENLVNARQTDATHEMSFHIEELSNNR
jgi:hypothetical protein